MMLADDSIGYNMYKFSAPMPYSIEDINKLLDINNRIKKSKITSLYACLPSNSELFTGFEQTRNFTFEHSNWDYWKKLIEYTFEKGADFIYLLNSPRPLDISNPNFIQKLERLDNLLIELNSIGVNKLRVASGQLSSYLGTHNKNFNILASTALEYKTIWEYQNFIAFHPEIKQIVPSHDINKNFKLLSIFKKRYPEIEIELMVNEVCLQGCPNRILHEYISIDEHTRINNDKYLSDFYATSFCNSVVNKYPIQSFVIGTHIFPWDIAEYEKIGIKNFKLARVMSHVSILGAQTRSNKKSAETLKGVNDTMDTFESESKDFNGGNSKIFDIVKRQMTGWLEQEYWVFEGFELQYKGIEPKILIEPLLREDLNIQSKEIHVFCFGGKPKIIIKMHNEREITLYDEELNCIDDYFSIGDIKIIQKADDLIKQTFDLSIKLCGAFNFVRVDWLIYQNKPYFGELTFTPNSGFNKYFNKKFNDKLGELINI